MAKKNSSSEEKKQSLSEKKVEELQNKIAPPAENAESYLENADKLSVEQIFEWSVRIGEERNLIKDQIELLEKRKGELKPALKKLKLKLKPKSRSLGKVKSVDLQTPSISKKERLEKKLAVSALKRELGDIDKALEKLTPKYSTILKSETRANNLQKFRSDAQSDSYVRKSYRFLESGTIAAINEIIKERPVEMKQLKQLSKAPAKLEDFNKMLLSLLNEINDDRTYIFCSVGISRERLLPAILETIKRLKPTQKKIEELIYP